MKDKTIEEVQELIGKPTYSLVNGAWVPPPDRRLFSPDEFYQLFRDESVVFIGDSLQRRAADTLHIMIEDRNDTTDSTRFFYGWPKAKIHLSRFIGKRPDLMHESSYKYNDIMKPTIGRIDNLFLPKYDRVQTFRYDPTRNHTIYIVGVGVWNNQKEGHSSITLEKVINETIHHLYREIPSSVQIYWKTIGWGETCQWAYKEPDVKNQNNNYQIYLANKVARSVIESINADNLRVLDWAREILPYSFEKDRFGMRAEPFNDGKPDKSNWHFGVRARMLLLQMLAWEVNQRKPFDSGGPTIHPSKIMLSPGRSRPSSSLPKLPAEMRIFQREEVLSVIVLCLLVMRITRKWKLRVRIY